LCVPRWASLGRDTVTARKGPGADYPALWVYRARGLPVQIIAETQLWRRICDQGGLPVWVDRAALNPRRMAQPMGSAPVPLMATPRADAAVKARLAPRALADLARCQGSWCKVTVAGVSGWTPAASLWGVAERPQCR
jgi:SH3-like domain-containing protein